MKERRMFTKKITESDSFLEMPCTAQAFYFHLSMNADDDGFVNSPKRIKKMCDASDDDFNLLIEKKFVIPFDGGIVVIRHWRLHNYIQKDRYVPTDYKEEKQQLGTDEHGAYTLAYQKEEYEKIFPEERKEKTYNDSFEEMWTIYPRKIGKARAYKCYQARLRSGYTEEELLRAAKNYENYCKKNNTEQKYIKYCSTFFSDSTPFVDFLESEVDDNGCSGSNDRKNEIDPYAAALENL